MTPSGNADSQIATAPIGLPEGRICFKCKQYKTADQFHKRYDGSVPRLRIARFMRRMGV